MGRGFGIDVASLRMPGLTGSGKGTPTTLVPAGDPVVLPPSLSPQLTALLPRPPAVTAAPPEVAVAPPPIKVVVEHVPLSDPRNPQHVAWLAQRDEASPPYLLYVGLGVAALAAAWWFMRKPKESTK